MTQDGFDPARARRAADVAHDYDALMGLASVAMGCGFLVAAAVHQYLVIFAGLLAARVCTWWYRHRLGVVRPSEEQAGRSWVVGALAAVALATLMLVDARLAPPLSLTLLGVAAALCTVQVFSLRRVGLTPVHWAVCAAMVLAALLPLAGVGGGAPVSGYVFTVVGAALVVLGVVDHVRLVRALPALPVGAGGRARA